MLGKPLGELFDVRVQKYLVDDLVRWHWYCYEADAFAEITANSAEEFDFVFADEAAWQQAQMLIAATVARNPSLKVIVDTTSPSLIATSHPPYTFVQLTSDLDDWLVTMRRILSDS